MAASDFSAATASIRSSVTGSAFRQPRSWSPRVATTFRVSPNCVANVASSPPSASRSGQAPAKLS